MTTPATAATPVLIVDDNRDAADMLGVMLESVGYDVRTAYSGPEALGVLHEFDPEIAVLDIGLPDMDGYELARRIGERWPSVHLVALTAYGQASDRTHAFEAGFEAHLVKPVAFTQLKSTLDDLVGK